MACAACGSSVSGGNGGDTGQGGNHTGGTGGATNSTGGTGGKTGGAGGAIDCAALRADEEATGVAVRVVNHTAADIFIQYDTNPFACSSSGYTVTSPSHEMLFTSLGVCGTTCATYSDMVTCTVTYTCAISEVTRIAPQGVFTMPWGGTVLEQKQLPHACFSAGGSPGATTNCQAFVKPKELPLTFTSTVGTAVTCNGSGACTCTPDANGTCTVEGSYQAGGTMLSAQGTYNAGDSTIDIVFE